MAEEDQTASNQRWFSWNLPQMPSDAQGWSDGAINVVKGGISYVSSAHIPWLHNESSVEDLMTSAEVRASRKEARKAILDGRVPWAWYQSELTTEAAVAKTKSATQPVPMTSYPLPEPVLPETNDFCIRPASVSHYFRNITIRTKLRFGLQQYYHFDCEKHLYLRKEQAVVEKAVVIGISGPGPRKKQQYPAARLVADLAASELPNSELHVISLECVGNDELINTMFSLLNNWQHIIEAAGLVMVVGWSHCVPVALDVLAKIAPLVQPHIKLGLLCIEPDLNDSEETHQILQSLVDRNTKITLMASTPKNLAINYQHPNIFRCFASSTRVPFITKLIDMCLTASNLGHDCHNLFNSLAPFLKDLAVCQTVYLPLTYHRAVQNVLDTTRLYSLQKLRNMPPISESNEFDLVWWFHEFLETFSEIRHIGSKAIISELISEYMHWEPDTPKFKELKYIFEFLKMGLDNPSLRNLVT